MLASYISLTTDSLASEALINDATCTYYYETRLCEQVLKTVSLRNRTAKRLCVANVTGLLLRCFDVIFTSVNVFWNFTKRPV